MSNFKYYNVDKFRPLYHHLYPIWGKDKHIHGQYYTSSFMLLNYINNIEIFFRVSLIHVITIFQRPLIFKKNPIPLIKINIHHIIKIQ